jgi:hypothetical protein
MVSVSGFNKIFYFHGIFKSLGYDDFVAVFLLNFIWGNDMKVQNKGQSTIEYLLLFSAVIVVAIVFLSPRGLFNSSLNRTYNSGTDELLNMATRAYR